MIVWICVLSYLLAGAVILSLMQAGLLFVLANNRDRLTKFTFSGHPFLWVVGWVAFWPFLLARIDLTFSSKR